MLIFTAILVGVAVFCLMPLSRWMRPKPFGLAVLIWLALMFIAYYTGGK